MRGAPRDLFGRGMVYVLIWSLQTLVATIVSPVLARVLDVAEFGSLSAAIALYQLLILCGVLGLDQALEMQRVEDDTDVRSRGLLAAGILYALTMTGFAMLTSPWWAHLLGFRDGGGLVLMALAWTLPGTGVVLMLALLQAEDRLGRFAAVSVLATVGSQVVGLGFLALGDRSAISFSWGGVVGQGVAFALGAFWTRPRWRGVGDIRLLRRAVVFGVPLLLAGLTQFVLNAGDRFVIQRSMGEAETGRYQVAFIIGSVLAIMLTFVNRAWLPRLKAVADDAERWALIVRSRDGIYWLLALSSLGVTIAAPALLRLFAPPSFRLESLTPVVFVVALCAIPVADSGATGRMLITVRSTAPLVWAAAIAVSVKVAMTLVLVHTWGLVGAAAGTLAAVSAQAILQRRAVAKRFGPASSSPAALVVLAGSAALGGASLWLPQDSPWNVARFLAAAALVPPFFMCLRSLMQDRVPFSRE